jgi:hypothetical protein
LGEAKDSASREQCQIYFEPCRNAAYLLQRPELFSYPDADFPYYPEPKRGTFFARQAEKTHEK